MIPDGPARAAIERFVRWGRETGWRPWSVTDESGTRCPQGRFLRAAASSPARIFQAGNRTGKTECGAADVALAALGFHPWFPHRPPIKVWCSGLDWEFGVGQVLWPKLRKFLPQEEIAHVAWYRRSPPEIPLTVFLRNGSQITFKSADSGRRKYQGENLHLLWLDEEHPEEVVEEGRARLIDHRGLLNVTCTPIMRLRWVQELARTATTEVVRASMLDAAAAGTIDRETALAYAASLPERQRRVRVDGDFVALEGLVYPEFSAATHVAVARGRQLLAPDGAVLATYPLPASWPRYASMDFGTSNPAAVPVIALDPRSGRRFVERCFYAAGLRPSLWAEVLDRELPELDAPLVCDHDAGDRLELERVGFDTLGANKGAGSVEAGIALVSRWLMRRLPDGHPALMIVEDHTARTPETGRCDGRGSSHSGLVWELEGYHYPKRRTDGPDAKDVPVKRDDHACDALRYLVDWLEENHGRSMGLPDLPRGVGGRRYDPSVTGAV